MNRQVTVCLPTTARPHYLRTALQTVQNQLGRERIAEVIVSENKSDRASEVLLREFPELPVRYLFREPTLPMVPHLFSTFREARTPYLGILNDDDWWCSNHLAGGLAALEAHPEAVAFAASSLFVQDEQHKNPFWIDHSAAVWLIAGRPSWLTNWTLDPIAMLALCWVYTPFHWSTLIVRTEAMRAVLDQLEGQHAFAHTMDRMVFARLALRGSFCYSPMPDTFVRWHPQNWMKTRPKPEIEAVVKSTAVAVGELARERGWDLLATWKRALGAMPPEAEPELLDRLQQSFKPAELRELGLASYFKTRPVNHRVRGLRGIAANVRRVIMGNP